MAAIRGHFRRGTDPFFLFCYQLAMYQVSCFYHKMHDSSQNCYISAPLKDILTRFSNCFKNIQRSILHFEKNVN